MQGWTDPSVRGTAWLTLSNCDRPLARAERLPEENERVTQAPLRSGGQQCQRIGVDGLGLLARATSASSCSIAGTGTRRKSKRCTRDRIVSGTLCGSLVASTRSTCGGGSSKRVQRKAFHASVVSMCASSMM